MGSTPPILGQFHLMRVNRQQPNVHGGSKPSEQTTFPLPFGHRYGNGVDPVMQIEQPFVPAQSQPKRSSSKHGSFVVNTLKTMRHRPSPDSVVIRPMKRRRLKELDDSQNPAKKQVFKPSRPVGNAEQIHHDVWRNVFRYCTPKDLLEARTLSKHFKNLLEEDSIWKDSRENYFGSDMPPCPSAITEVQYAELLVGKGCQNSRCDKQRTAKVYWTFMGRLCVDCLRQKTVTGQTLANIPLPTLDLPDDLEVEFSGGRGGVQISPSTIWLSAIPSATTRYGRYDCCRWHEVRIRNSFVQTFLGHLFLRKDYESISQEYDSMKETASAEEIQNWIRDKFLATKRHLVQVAAIENWEHFGRFVSTPNHRAEREIFFKEKAAELEPPMSPSVLEHMLAYCKALDTSNAPSERAWDVLKEKIIPYRAQAEKVHEYCRSLIVGAYTPTLYSSVQLFKRLQLHRAGRKKLEEPSWETEQLFVIEIGEEALHSCLTDEIGDADIVLECLKRTYESFQSAQNVPNGLNYDGKREQYKLSLDDARMILEEVIQRHIEPHTPRGAIVFDHFRCIGCTRADCKKFSFEKLFEHIAHTHATVVGEGSEFERLARPFPRPFETKAWNENFAWYTIAWPRNLPILPYHQKASGRAWRADDEMEYRPQEKVPVRSAFEGRNLQVAGDIDGSDFAGNLVHAADVMKAATRLDSLHVAKIVLTYAIDRWRGDADANPPLDLFMDSVNDIKKANPSLAMKFRCGTCLKQDTVHKSARQVKYMLPIEVLCEHWRSSHLEGDEIDDWVANMMALPSDDEVWHAMVTADSKLKQEKDKLLLQQKKLTGNCRRRPNAKMKVVQDTQFALDVFEGLYPRKDEEQLQQS